MASNAGQSPKDEWTEVTVETTDKVWDRKAPVEGKLVDIKHDVGPNESMLYFLKTDKEKVGVWGSTVLDTKFSGIANGSMVRIEPQGKVKSEKTGREYQDFKVFVKPPSFEEVGEEVPLDEMPDGFLT